MPRADRSRYFELAHRYVDIAVRAGDLPKLDGSIACEDCGNPASEYDHRDYKKPMEVAPVCRACNQARGPGLHRDPSETAVKPPTILQRYYGRPQHGRGFQASRERHNRNWKRDDAIADAYRRGERLSAIAAAHGVSVPSISRIAAKFGLRRNRIH